MTTALWLILGGYAALATAGWMLAEYRAARAERLLAAEQKQARFWAGVMTQMLSGDVVVEMKPKEQSCRAQRD